MSISEQQILDIFSQLPKDSDGISDSLLKDRFRALLYLFSHDGKISNEVLENVAQKTNSNFVWALLGRQGEKIPITLSDIILDKGKITNQDQLLTAIKTYANKTLSEYSFSSKDVSLFPVAVNSYNMPAVEKLLPWVQGKITLPEVDDKYPRLAQEFDKIKGQVNYHNAIVNAKEESQRRIANMKIS